MTTLYLCGAGNAEGIRLAIVINQSQKRWDQIVILDDDASKHGRLMLGVEIVGPFSLLKHADPVSSEVVNLVTRTTRRRKFALQKIQQYGFTQTNFSRFGQTPIGPTEIYGSSSLIRQVGLR